MDRVRGEEQMNLKVGAVTKYWVDKKATEVKYTQIDPAVLQALLVNPEIDLADEENARQSAHRLNAALNAVDIVIEPKYDEKNERYLLVIKRTQHGNLHLTSLDVDFLHSGDYEQIKKTAQEVRQSILDLRSAEHGQAKP